MALKLDALTSAVADVASLARKTLDANAACEAAVAAAAEANARAADAEAEVAQAQKDIDALAAELEAAIGSAVASLRAPQEPAGEPVITTVASVPPASETAPVIPAPHAEVQGLAAVSNALSGLFSKKPTTDISASLAAMKANEPK